MKRKHFLLLAGCLLGMSLVLLVLYAFSPLNGEIYRANFYRNFAPEPAITEKAALDLGYDSYYLAGATSGKIYLGNYTAPLHMAVTNIMLTDSQHVQLKVIGLDSIVVEPERFRTAVDSPYFFLTHGIIPILFRGNLDRWEANRFMPDSAYFIDAVPMGATSFALRSYNAVSKTYELAKEAIDSPYFDFKFGLLEKQIDGIFCTEGKLHYSKELKQLIYLYSYRNQYSIMDTSLNLLHRYNTIDTFSHARITVANIESENSSMLSSPPAITNSLSAVSGKHLFIKSNLLAKNEDKEKFTSANIIDVYDITTGTYRHSFYLPYYRDKKLLEFQVNNNRLIALFERYLVVYDLGVQRQEAHQHL